MRPIRLLFGLYILVFATCVVVGISAEEHLRWPLVALGGLVALQGVCIVFNLLGATDDILENARKGRAVAPVFEERGFIRLQGLFMAVVGVLFAGIALGTGGDALDR